MNTCGNLMFISYLDKLPLKLQSKCYNLLQSVQSFQKPPKVRKIVAWKSKSGISSLENVCLINQSISKSISFAQEKDFSL